jgi:hypothetical protein
MGTKRSKVTCKQRKAKAAAHHMKIISTKRTAISTRRQQLNAVSKHGDDIQNDKKGSVSKPEKKCTTVGRLKLRPKFWNGCSKETQQSKSNSLKKCNEDDEKRSYSKEIASLREREANSRQQQNNKKNARLNKIVPYPATFHAEPTNIQEKILDAAVLVRSAMFIGEVSRPFTAEAENGSTSLSNTNPVNISGNLREWWAAPETKNSSAECVRNPWAVLGTGDSSSDEEDDHANNYSSMDNNPGIIKARSLPLSKSVARPLIFAPSTLKFGSFEISSALSQEVNPPISMLSISEKSHYCNTDIDPDL